MNKESFENSENLESIFEKDYLKEKSKKIIEYLQSYKLVEEQIYCTEGHMV